MVVAAPVSVPYERFSRESAHWWLAKALSDLGKQSGMSAEDIDGLCVSSFTAIAPGPIVTPMFTEVVPEDSDKAEQIAASLPVRRLGRPDDVARAAMFLLAPDNGFVTGQCIFVCGGASLGSLAL